MISHTGSISVMFSRLYLGVHSPADIVAGGIVGCIILAYWIKIDNVVDRYISYGDNGMPIIITIIISSSHSRCRRHLHRVIVMVIMVMMIVMIVIIVKKCLYECSLYFTLYTKLHPASFDVPRNCLITLTVPNWANFWSRKCCQ